MGTSRKLYGIALVALVVLAACEPRAEDDAALADSAALNPDTTAAQTAEPVVTDLDEVDDSGISGDATATHSPTEVTVSIVLKEGGKPDVSYPAHIHTGTCEAGGPVAVELSPVSNLQSSKTVPLSALPANQDAFVQVHDPGGKPVACGDMKGHGGMHTGGPARTTTH